MQINNNPKRLNFFLCYGIHYSGTKFIYKGKCMIDGKTIYLDKKICVFLFHQKYYYFEVDGKVAHCDRLNHYNVYGILPPDNKNQMQEKREFYWTDDIVINTIWYIIAMLISTLFRDRIGLWLLITWIYYDATFRKKKEIRKVRCNYERKIGKRS